MRLVHLDCNAVLLPQSMLSCFRLGVLLACAAQLYQVHITWVNWTLLYIQDLFQVTVVLTSCTSGTLHKRNRLCMTISIDICLMQAKPPCIQHCQEQVFSKHLCACPTQMRRCRKGTLQMQTLTVHISLYSWVVAKRCEIELTCVDMK